MSTKVGGKNVNNSSPGDQSCRQCKKSLVGRRYIVHEGQNYCIPCYEARFSNTCESCHTLIGTDCKDLAYKDKHWHDSCFVCSECKTTLLEKMFAYRDEKLYCAECFEKVQAMGCDVCHKPFTTGMKKYEYKGKRWHEDCFKCRDCKGFIGSSSFIHYKSNPVCLMCYDNKYALHCTKCEKVIAKGGLLYKDIPWHMECFTCSNCNKPLAGDKFTTHDTKQYCLDCYCKLFAERCSRCSGCIIGAGGVKYISFENHSWHMDCFTCRKCAKKLAGQGFLIKDGDIFCPDCGQLF